MCVHLPLPLSPGQYESAERDLSRALQLNPEFTDAQLFLTQVQRDLEAGHRFNTADPSNKE